MKMNRLPLLAALACVAGTASAQSTLTVFGVMDLAARYVHNEGAGSVKSLASGGNQTSRIGFRATEDLGDGLSAGFHLEAGLLADTGTSVSAAQFFDRRSTLSLASSRLGELRAGRDYVPTYFNWTRIDPFSYVGVGGSSNLISGVPRGPIRSAFGTGPNTAVRSSNAIELFLPPELGGVEGALMVAAGEGGTAANGQDKLVGARLGYARGPAFVAAAAMTTRNDLTGSDRFKDWDVVGSWDFDVVKLFAGWRVFKFDTSRQTNKLLGAIAPLGPGELKLSYQQADLQGRVGASDVSANDARQWAMGYVYNLSKRTALYATAARITNDGAAAFALPGGPAGLVAGGRSSGYELGMRHNF